MGRFQIPPAYEFPKPLYTVQWSNVGWLWKTTRGAWAGEPIVTPALEDIATLQCYGGQPYEYLYRCLKEDAPAKIDGLPFIAAYYSPQMDVFYLFPDTIQGHRNYIGFVRSQARCEMGFAAVRLHKGFYQLSQKMSKYLTSGVYDEQG